VTSPAGTWWTTGGFGQWFVTDQTVAPLSAFPIAPAADGSFQALVDQTGFGSHILYQDVVIPPSISVTLNLMLWFENYKPGLLRSSEPR
jgi:hypothetical protein